jgi:8-oxo-dGTP pyrophosphatase MutT (NUDIX family)
MSRKPGHIQYAALPFRRRADATIEIMLITSRDTGRWLIPKGWPEPGLAPAETAAHEAREEGGLVGRIGDRSIGSYHYDKRLPDGSTVDCVVEVFALDVTRQLKSWPERDERTTRWFGPQEAAEAVKEPELRAIIQNLQRAFGPAYRGDARD